MTPINKDLNNNTFYYKPFRYLPDQPKAVKTVLDRSPEMGKSEAQGNAAAYEPSVYDGGNWAVSDAHGKAGGFGL